MADKLAKPTQPVEPAPKKKKPKKRTIFDDIGDEYNKNKKVVGDFLGAYKDMYDSVINALRGNRTARPGR